MHLIRINLTFCRILCRDTSIYSIGINQYKLIHICCKIDLDQHIIYDESFWLIYGMFQMRTTHMHANTINRFDKNANYHYANYDKYNRSRLFPFAFSPWLAIMCVVFHLCCHTDQFILIQAHISVIQLTHQYFPLVFYSLFTHTHASKLSTSLSQQFQ